MPEIIDDSLFPQLPVAVDTEQMQQLLQQTLPGYADGEHRITALKIRRFQHRPGRRCEICYAIDTESQMGESEKQQLLYGFMGRAQEAAQAVQTIQRKAIKPSRFLPSIYYLEPLDMALWSFPNDPALANLEQLFELTYFQELFSLPVHNLVTLSAALQQLDTQIIKYVPATRCVARHTFWHRISKAGKPLLQLYSKVYSQGRGETVFAVMQALWHGAKSQGGALHLPQPLAYDPKLDAIFTPALDGINALDAYCAEPNERIMIKAGHLLAAFHQCTVGNAPTIASDEPVRALADLVTMLTYVAAPVAAAVARVSQVLQRLFVELYDTNDQGALPMVSLHTAFRINQLRLVDDNLVLFDFDGVSKGNPLEDVSSFVAHLIYLQIKGAFPVERVNAAIDAFCRGYAEVAPWPVPEQLLHWHIATQLLTKHIKKTIKRGKTDSQRQQLALLAAAERVLTTGMLIKDPTVTSQQNKIFTSSQPGISNQPNVAPNVSTVTDTTLMAGHFAAYLQQAYPARALALLGCTIDKVTVRPKEQRIDVLYRLYLQELTQPPFEQWFFVQFCDDPTAYTPLCYTHNRERPTGWKEVDSWTALGALVWAFPHDARLPHLAEAADCNRIAEIATDAAATLGFSPGTTCIRAVRHLIKYMPHKRCVLRFLLTMADPIKGESSLVIYSKSYGDGTSGTIYGAFQQVKQAWADYPHLAVPATVLHLSALDTYWQMEWAGHSLEEHYSDEAYEAILPLVVDALVSFHQSKLTGLPLAPDGLTQAKEAQRNGKKIGQFLPAEREAMSRLGDQISAGYHQLPTVELPIVPLHGTFRLSQLLQQGKSVAVTDLDAIGLGDPHYDVAEFMATVRYQQFRRQLPAAVLVVQAERFYECYQEQVSWRLDRRRLHWYCAASLLRKFRQSLKGAESEVLQQRRAIIAAIDDELTKASLPLHRNSLSHRNVQSNEG